VLAVMDYVLSAFLRWLHPFMPHITDELWDILGFGAGASIQFIAPPERSSLWKGIDARNKVAAIYETVTQGRNLRAEARVPSNKKATFIFKPNENLIEAELPTIARLLNAESLTSDSTFAPPTGTPAALTPLGELYLIPAAATDVPAEIERLEKEIAKALAELETVGRKLGNSAFVSNAPAAVVEEHKKRKTDFTERLAQLRQMRAALDEK